MPKYIAFGSYERKGVRYRFMVMERFGTDLQKLFENNGKEFSRKTVLQLGLSLVSVNCVAAISYGDIDLGQHWLR